MLGLTQYSQHSVVLEDLHGAWADKVDGLQGVTLPDEELAWGAEGGLDDEGQRAQAASAGRLKERQLQQLLVQVHGDVSPQLIWEVLQELSVTTQLSQLSPSSDFWYFFSSLQFSFWFSFYFKWFPTVMQNNTRLPCSCFLLLRWTAALPSPRWRLFHCWLTTWSGSTPACAAPGPWAAGGPWWSPSGPWCGCGRASGGSTSSGWWLSHYQTPRRASGLQTEQWFEWSSGGITSFICNFHVSSGTYNTDTKMTQVLTFLFLTHKILMWDSISRFHSCLLVWNHDLLNACEGSVLGLRSLFGWEAKCPQDLTEVQLLLFLSHSIYGIIPQPLIDL